MKSFSLSLSLSATQDMRRTFFSITHTPTTTLGNSIPFCPCPRPPPGSASISAMPPGCKLSLPACNSSSKDRCCRSTSSNVHRRIRRRWRVCSHGREKKKHTHGDYDGSGLRNEKTPANQPSTLSQMREERERDTMRRTAAATVAAAAVFFPFFFFNGAARTARTWSSSATHDSSTAPVVPFFVTHYQTDVHALICD